VWVDVPEALADELAGSVGGETLGVEVVEGAPGRATLSIFAESEDGARGAAQRVRRVLHELAGPGESPGESVVSTVVDDHWVERYQVRLRPLPLGGRFVVLPPGMDSPSETGRIAIRMVPGRAFGTGEHPTTRLCAAALEGAVSSGSLWIDVGTGSGILAILAARCGARRVIAVDIDPDAVEVAREWIVRNDVGASVEARTSGIAALPGEAADGVVVNISASYLEDEAGALASVLRAGGKMIASGFLAGDLEEVSSALRTAGFREAARSESEGWACLVMRRPAEETPWGE
jgi:ribosomal protein L11 methyltransferase